MSLRNLILLSMLCCIKSTCLPNCTCYLDFKGRNALLCKDGGMIGPLAFTNITLDIEVVKITAPEDNMNTLTMSPVFQNYRNLEEIYVTRSNIPQLGMHFFWGLTKLDILDLSQNNITQPLDHNFRGLTKLKELYLDDNRINSLPSGTFKYLQELKLLSIQRNRINELMPRIFLEIKKLKVLKLNGNHLNELNPVVFEDIQELKALECRGCGLTKIDRQVYELLPNLAHLDLGDNELTSLTPDEFAPVKQLKYLKLDGNHFTTIKSSIFINQFELKKLNLAHNSITKLDRNTFEHLHNLTELDLSYNKLENLENGLLEPVASTLEVLVLSGNHFKLYNLKGLLSNLQLKELHLAESGMIDVSSIKIFPDTLNVLNLAGNHFSAISPDIIPSHLIELDLSRNRLRGLSDEFLLQTDKLKMRLRLERNPWSCDLCHIIPMLERVNRSAMIRDVKCAHPFTTEGKTLGTLQRKDLTWCTVPSYTSSDANFFLLGDDGKIGLIAASTSICLLFLTVFVIVTAICYSRRHAAKYYTHEDKLAMEGDSIYDNHSPLFCDEKELSFKFPLDNCEKKLSISTIDEIKKEHTINNGT